LIDVHTTFWVEIVQQCSYRRWNLVPDAETNPVPDLRDTRTRNWRRKNGVGLWRRFLGRVSWV